jgi:MauM/NapG family ferredoxin protein
MNRQLRKNRFRWTRTARRLVQTGFLLLFLYPFILEVYKRATMEPAPVMTSILLPWDPLLFLAQVLRQNWLFIIIGAPLLMITISLFFGRAFCGWICPLGTLMDWVQSLIFWRNFPRKVKPVGDNREKRNNPFRYYLLIITLVGALAGLQLAGILDPLVIFNRIMAALVTDVFSLQQSPIRVSLSIFSLVFVTIAILEIWRPRFWCRNLCPTGALIGLFSRWSLLNRQVTNSCTSCGECSRVCPMNAIPSEPHDTDYSDCIMCLECESSCPKNGVVFTFGRLSQKGWQRKITNISIPRAKQWDGQYQDFESRLGWLKIGRRDFIGGITSGVVALIGLILLPRTAKKTVLRPPGALPEEEFIRTCIICQECVRVCPTGGIRPTFFESGVTAIGTPKLVPRQGGCSLNPSCPNLCAKVCPVGAILPTKPEEMKVGIAKVDHSLCLAWDQGVKCLVCVEACLNEAAQAFQGRITVDPKKCTGCGRCESGCPVAGSAIHVYPREL